MSFDLWLAYVVACVVLLVIPGPTILAVLSYSLSEGPRVRVPAILAVAAGDATALLWSLMGLGALLAYSSFWFQVMKWAGGLYLIYLGASMIYSAAHAGFSMVKADHALSEVDSNAGMRNKKVFRNIYLATVFNPKGIIFFIAFLPQFTNPAASLNKQLWILAVTFVLLAALNAAVYSFFAERVRGVVSGGKAQKGFNLGGGSLLMAAGAWALTIRTS